MSITKQRNSKSLARSRVGGYWWSLLGKFYDGYTKTNVISKAVTFL